jgi:exodeoxyribonuclease VIII
MLQPNIESRAAYDELRSLNFSGIKELLASPERYQRYLTTPREETKALRQGIMSHMATLEPERFLSTYVVVPEDAPKKPTEIQRNAKKPSDDTIAAIAYWDAFNAKCAGKVIVTAEEYELALSLSRRFKTIVEGIGCRTFVATEMMISVEYAGVPMKCAIDAVGDDGYLYDFKTTSDDASPKQFIRTSLNFKYNLQAVVYRTLFEAYTGQRVKGFRVVPVEKDTLFGAVYEFGPEMQTRGLFDFEEALRIYKECTASGIWPGYVADTSTATVIDVEARPSLSTPINFA